MTVSVQPTGQTCSVTNGSGTVSGADVTNVQVDCVDASFSVGGTVSGLTGAGLVLQNNGGDDLAVGADGPFQFSTPVPDGDPYDVTVSVQPTGQTCSVTNGSGTVSGADVTDVVVDCGDIQIGVSTTSVDFPDAQVGESSGATVTVSNTGTGDLDISGITTAAPFAVTGGTCLPLPTTLTAGADCTIELTFSPVSEGDFAGTLEIVSNAATSPHQRQSQWIHVICSGRAHVRVPWVGRSDPGPAGWRVCCTAQVSDCRHVVLPTYEKAKQQTGAAMGCTGFFLVLVSSLREFRAGFQFH